MIAHRLARGELLLLLVILVLAALLRLPGLEARGRWDADQGHDMLVLHALVSRGEVPLLGPPTSIGDFHHGALYYYLLAPAAALAGADPVVVTAWIALIGVAAVAATWWLARLVGGPVAGLSAALLGAVSPAGIDESTFIWNPNLIPLASALAFGAAIRAWQTRRPGWWLVSAAGAMAVSQLHVLGIVVVPPLALAWVVDLRRRRAHAAPTRPLILAGVGAVAILALGYLPLVVNELTHDFAETRAVLDYVAGGGRSGERDAVSTLLVIGLRSIAWPVAGLLTDRPQLAAVAVLAAAGLAGLAALTPGPGRRAARWLLATIAWSIASLAVLAPGLATITPGLPNDHYHAFLDPLVLTLVGLGLARLAVGLPGASAAARRAGRAVAAVALTGLVSLGVVSAPPAVSPDGGWLQADQAAARVHAVTGARAFALDGIPPFKSADALRFPLERRGATPLPADAIGMPSDDPPMIVLVCDPLFEEVVGAACGGPAEARWATEHGVTSLPLDRFEAGTRRVITVYRSPQG